MLLQLTPSPRFSHAKECDIPGTVDLSVREGDDTAYGQALYPVPAEDPNDPLQVRLCLCLPFGRVAHPSR